MGIVGFMAGYVVWCSITLLSQEATSLQGTCFCNDGGGQRRRQVESREFMETEAVERANVPSSGWSKQILLLYVHLGL